MFSAAGGGARSRAFWVIVLGLVVALVVSAVDAVVLPMAASASAPSRAVDPRDVPVLPGDRPAAAPVGAPARPDVDFAPLASRSGGSHFDAHRSQVVSRSALTDEYANPDGTHTFKQSLGVGGHEKLPWGGQLGARWRS